MTRLCEDPLRSALWFVIPPSNMALLLKESSHYHITRCHSHQVKLLCTSSSGAWQKPFKGFPSDLGRTVLCSCTSKFLQTLGNLSEDTFNNCSHILLWQTRQNCKDVLYYLLCSGSITAGVTCRKALQKENCIMKERGGGEEKVCIITPSENNQLILVISRIGI